MFFSRIQRRYECRTFVYLQIAAQCTLRGVSSHSISTHRMATIATRQAGGDPAANIRRALSTRGCLDLEIEFRLGSRDPRSGNFIPGVNSQAFCRLEKALESSAAFVEQPPNCTTDFYFRGTDGRLEESSGAWVTKDKIAVHDFPDGHVRCGAAYEIRRTPRIGTDPGTCSFYRKKVRRSWMWAEMPWRVDMTRVQSNEDLDAEDYIYEIEIELIADPAVYATPLSALVESGKSIAFDFSRMCFDPQKT